MEAVVYVAIMAAGFVGCLLAGYYVTKRSLRK